LQLTRLRFAHILVRIAEQHDQRPGVLTEHAVEPSLDARLQRRRSDNEARLAWPTGGEQDNGGKRGETDHRHERVHSIIPRRAQARFRASTSVVNAFA